MKPVYRWSCADCALLDKSRKKWSENNYCYLYGCNKKKDGYVVGWCRADKELTLQGCSDFKPITAEAPRAEHNPTPKPVPKPTRPESVQLSIFDLI